MSTLALDAGLPDSFTSEPATGAHVDEVFDLAAAELTAAFGFNPETAEDIRSWLEPPSGGRCEQLLIRDRDQGALVQWWGGLQEHAFDAAAQEGYDDVILHVDSTNEHDAPSVYQRAGFEVRCAFNAFARDLDAGE